jgi:hypothetical protein
MIQRALLGITLLFSFQAIGQDSIWTKQTKVGDVIAFEKGISGVTFLQQSVGLSKDYYPLIDRYKPCNPIVAQRPSKGGLPVYAEYFFTPIDSVLRLVSYDWEVDRYGNFFDKQKIWEEEAKKFTVYNDQYERVKSQLMQLFGEPSTTDTKANKVNSNRGNYLSRESVWEREDVHVGLSMIFESMTYRVRMTMYWKQ